MVHVLQCQPWRHACHVACCCAHTYRRARSAPRPELAGFLEPLPCAHAHTSAAPRSHITTQDNNHHAPRGWLPAARRACWAPKPRPADCHVPPATPLSGPSEGRAFGAPRARANAGSASASRAAPGGPPAAQSTRCPHATPSAAKQRSSVPACGEAASSRTSSSAPSGSPPPSTRSRSAWPLETSVWPCSPARVPAPGGARRAARQRPLLCICGDAVSACAPCD